MAVAENVTDADLSRMNLNVDLLRLEGEYDYLVKHIKIPEGDELIRAESFIRQANEDTLNYNEEFDGLADSQVMIIHTTLLAVAKDDTNLGPNVRAHGIIFYSRNIAMMMDELKKDDDPKQAIVAMKDPLVKHYKNIQSKYIKQNDIGNLAYWDLKQLLFEVQYKFIVPIINI